MNKTHLNFASTHLFEHLLQVFQCEVSGPREPVGAAVATAILITVERAVTLVHEHGCIHHW